MLGLHTRSTDKSIVAAGTISHHVRDDPQHISTSRAPCDVEVCWCSLGAGELFGSSFNQQDSTPYEAPNALFAVAIWPDSATYRVGE